MLLMPATNNQRFDELDLIACFGDWFVGYHVQLLATQTLCEFKHGRAKVLTELLHMLLSNFQLSETKAVIHYCLRPRGLDLLSSMRGHAYGQTRGVVRQRGAAGFERLTMMCDREQALPRGPGRFYGGNPASRETTAKKNSH
jgi:hypothetical protein